MNTGIGTYLVYSEEGLGTLSSSTVKSLTINTQFAPSMLETKKDVDLIPFQTIEDLSLFGLVGDEAREKLLSQIYNSKILQSLYLSSNMDLSPFSLLINGNVAKSVQRLEITSREEPLTYAFLTKLGRSLEYVTALKALVLHLRGPVLGNYYAVLINSRESAVEFRFRGGLSAIDFFTLGLNYKSSNTMQVKGNKISLDCEQFHNTTFLKLDFKTVQ